MRRFSPDPKPHERIYDPKAGIDKVIREGKCRVCKAKGTWRKEDQPTEYGLTRHHLVPKSLGGDDVEDNLVPVCGHGTAGCHGDIEHWQAHARQHLRASLTPPELDYIISKKGADWLDRYYPKG